MTFANGVEEALPSELIAPGFLASVLPSLQTTTGSPGSSVRVLDSYEHPERGRAQAHRLSSRKVVVRPLTGEGPDPHCSNRDGRLE